MQLFWFKWTLFVFVLVIIIVIHRWKLSIKRLCFSFFCGGLDCVLFAALFVALFSQMYQKFAINIVEKKACCCWVGSYCCNFMVVDCGRPFWHRNWCDQMTTSDATEVSFWAFFNKICSIYKRISLRSFPFTCRLQACNKFYWLFKPILNSIWNFIRKSK